jgi:glycerol-3-phosphate O-acyltransferase/dihydroxyacetone phosphate acyltransferase
MGVAKAVFLRGVAGLLKLYYRDVRVLGHVPEATTGRRLFAGNHVNALLDPVIVMTACSCPMAPVAKEPLFRMPVIGALLRIAEAVPIVRRKDAPEGDAKANERAFAKVAAHLGAGRNILIFPEGISHNEARVQPLKTGAARMLAGASALGIEGLTYQSVGLEFDAKDIFRSRVVVVFGPVRSFPAEADERTVVATVTQTLEADLRSLLVEGETPEARALLLRVAELYVDDGNDFAAALEVAREVRRARAALAATRGELVASLEADVNAYFRALAAGRLRDADVAPRGRLRTASWGSRLRLLMLAPLALVGAVLYALPYRVPRLVARTSGPEIDLRSTYKLLSGVLVFVVWALLLLWAVWKVPGLPFAVGAAVVVFAPLAALVWLDAFDEAPGFFAASPSRLAALRAQRAFLLTRLEEARALATTESSAPGAPSGVG